MTISSNALSFYYTLLYFADKNTLKYTEVEKNPDSLWEDKTKFDGETTFVTDVDLAVINR